LDPAGDFSNCCNPLDFADSLDRLIGGQCYHLLVFEMTTYMFVREEEEEDCEDCDCEDCEDEE
jgi:hypothetical protein